MRSNSPLALENWTGYRSWLFGSKNGQDKHYVTYKAACQLMRPTTRMLAHVRDLHAAHSDQGPIAECRFLTIDSDWTTELSLSAEALAFWARHALSAYGTGADAEHRGVGPLQRGREGGSGDDAGRGPAVTRASRKCEQHHLADREPGHGDGASAFQPPRPSQALAPHATQLWGLSWLGPRSFPGSGSPGSSSRASGMAMRDGNGAGRRSASAGRTGRACSCTWAGCLWPRSRCFGDRGSA